MILSGRGELGLEEEGEGKLGRGGVEEEGMEEGLLARERAWVASGGREVRWREAVRGRGREGGEVDVGGGISEVILGDGCGWRWWVGAIWLGVGEVSRLVPGCRVRKTYAHDI